MVDLLFDCIVIFLCASCIVVLITSLGALFALLFEHLSSDR